MCVILAVPIKTSAWKGSINFALDDYKQIDISITEYVELAV